MGWGPAAGSTPASRFRHARRSPSSWMPGFRRVTAGARQRKGGLCGQGQQVEVVARPRGALSTDGVGPGRGAVHGQAHAPPGSLLDPVVTPAQAHQVHGGGRAGRPRPDVVEVAEPGGHRAAREPAPPVTGADQCRELRPGPVRRRPSRPNRTRGPGVVVEEGTGAAVTPRKPHPHPGRPVHEPDQPGAPHQHRIPRERPVRLHQSLVHRVRSPGCGGGGDSSAAGNRTPAARRSWTVQRPRGRAGVGARAGAGPPSVGDRVLRTASRPGRRGRRPRTW